MNNLMRRSGIVALLCLVLSLMLVITACGGDDPVETTGAPETTAPDVTTAEPDDTTAEPDDTTAEPEAKVTYTITVKDTDGNPIAGVKVQICEGEVCIPGTTGADGVATIEAVEGVYQASVTKADGYIFDATAKVDLVDNAAVITLEKAPAPVVPGDSIVITESIGSPEEPEELELKANKPVTYTYTAATKGVIGIAVVKGSTASIVINNKTTGKAGQTVNGVGSAAAVAKAGSTYEIVVSSTEDATIEIAIIIYNSGDGSRENPFQIQNIYDYSEEMEMLLGYADNYYDNAVKAELAAGKTVWYSIQCYYFAINDPSVNVSYKGTLYPCNAGGERVFTYVVDEETESVELYLNGEKIADCDDEDDLVFGLSAAADTETEITLRDGSYSYPYWTDSFEGPFTIVGGSTVVYNLIPGSYANGNYVLMVAEDTADGVGFASRFGMGVATMTQASVDAMGESYGYYAAFTVANMTEDTEVLYVDVVDAANVAGIMFSGNPVIVEEGVEYDLADYELAAAINANYGGMVVFAYEAKAAGTVTVVNTGDCACDADWQLSNMNTYLTNEYGDLVMNVSAGDVVEIIVVGEGCTFEVTFTAAPELELQ